MLDRYVAAIRHLAGQPSQVQGAVNGGSAMPAAPETRSHAAAPHTMLTSPPREASANIAGADARTDARLDEITKSIDELYRRTGRPGGERADDDATFARKDAREMCIVKHELAVPKNDGHAPAYQPSASEIDEAMLARKAMRSLRRHGNVDRLDQLERKSLTSFAFGTN
jgi:hypothetical protein